MDTAWLESIAWNERGLLPVIVQEHASGDVLMMAWMNREALSETVATGRSVFYSRSRQRLWRKGETSGHHQQVHDMALDCDGDTLLLRVTQHGHDPSIACHTGRHSCFYRRLEAGQWQDAAAVLKDPTTIYGS